MILHDYMMRERARNKQARRLHDKRGRALRLSRAMQDPDVVFCIVGGMFVAAICLACLVGFLMPI